MNAKNNDGSTPLILAIKNHDKNTVAALENSLFLVLAGTTNNEEIQLFISDSTLK